MFLCLGTPTYHKAEVFLLSSYSVCIMQTHPEQLHRTAFTHSRSRVPASVTPFLSLCHLNPVLFAAFSQGSELGHPGLIYHYSSSPSSLQNCLWLLLGGEERKRNTLFCVTQTQMALQFLLFIKYPKTSTRISNDFQVPVSHWNYFQRGQTVPQWED